MKKPNKAQIQMLELDDISPHPGYQRDLIKPHVNGLIAAFDPELVGVLMVSPRKTGGYYVWDGNHRLNALKAKGYTHWHCMVTDKSDIESSIAFEETNDRVRRVTPIQKHTARLFRDDPRALALEGALYKAGCHTGTSGEGSVKAITACYKVLDYSGPAVLTRTLRVLNDVWGNESSSKSGALIGGLAMFYDLHPKAKNTLVVKALDSYPTGGAFVGAAQAKYAASGGSKGHNQCKLLESQIYATV